MQKILILAANPKNTSRLRLDEELRDIEEGLKRAQHRDRFALTQRLAVRPRDIQRAMLEETPQIVHFSGHGDGEDGLVFEDDTGQGKVVSGAALADLFALFADPAEFPDPINCVVLNGCYSAVQAEAIAEHVPYVVGMTKAVGDRAAIEFAVGFYDAIGAGRSVEFAFKLGCTAISLAGIPENATPILLNKKSTQTRVLWKITFEGELSGTTSDQNLIDKILAQLKFMSKDMSLTCVRFERGSIVILLEGSEEGYSIIEALFGSGQVCNVLGLPIKSIDLVRADPYVGEAAIAASPTSYIPQTRTELYRFLLNLPGPQFDQVIFDLNPPKGNISPAQAPQGQRVPELLTWLESPIGPGLKALRTSLAKVLDPR